MKFNISFPIAHRPVLDSFGKVSLLGSCFAEHQATAFVRIGYEVLSNPFGVLYDPLSWARLLQRTANEDWFTTSDFELGAQGYFSFEMHGDMTFDTLDEAVGQSNTKLRRLRDHLVNSKLIVLTFGSSIVFEHLEKDMSVANCHKLPNSLFKRVQMSVESCVEAMDRIENALQKLCPDSPRVTSISPVRHVRSGIPENFLSKSTLRVALDRSRLSDSYFPSYEIFIDELRDYRFAKADMIHPNAQAQAYIWERFIETVASSDLKEQIDEVEKFRRFEAHRPKRKAEEHERAVAKASDELLKKWPTLKL